MSIDTEIEVVYIHTIIINGVHGQITVIRMYPLLRTEKFNQELCTDTRKNNMIADRVLLLYLH